MPRWKSFLFNITITLNVLLVFLLFFESRIAIPAWLQVAGRMHPMILHFPLVLVVLYATFSLRTNKKEAGANDQLLLLLAAFSAALAAAMGFFLSREEGYEADALAWHKWPGLILSWFLLIWYILSPRINASGVARWSVSIASLLLIFITGHEGAGLTHGSDYLLAPIRPQQSIPAVSEEEAVVYTHLVQPILQSKCISCHNSSKAKGELIMETEAQLRKGGKSGALWDSTATDHGLLLRRIHLPLEDKKHMAPKGKTQLTDEEIAILQQWIRKGADFNLRVASLDPSDTLRMLARTRLGGQQNEAYTFAAADPSVIKELNTVNRVVTEEALFSPALSVSFFNSQLYKPEQLKDLSKIKEQIVSLDLAHMPVTDRDLNTISELSNLRKLNLSFTTITGQSLAELKKLKHLQNLSLSGTQVKADQLNTLQGFPKLQTVYIWSTPAAGSPVSLKNIRVETGFRDDTTRLKLSLPVLLNEETVITSATTLQLKHYIKGVSIRYTLDGTEPDSISSPEYKGNEVINGTVLLRARAYKAGWISSDLLQASFYKSGYRPDTVIFQQLPDPSYPPNPTLLTDLIKGETNFKNGNWLGWRTTEADLLLPLQKPSLISSVTLSTLIDLGSYIFPPGVLQVWGGDEPGKLRLLGEIKPEQPKELQPVYLRGYTCSFSPVTVKYLRVKAIPVSKLPAWHPGKGDKGWIFADEILIN
ncbi:MAG: chitobiase/beta-hexosaminidase C-terminal domain-containing protein [Chitinophagaceae bacterium]|nr:chitobiase/beta-hexosaminidase C-terminal domain-containing protein [Chitinophagaceae bacterium]